MQVAIKPKSGYSSTKVTKAPNWHGLVAWDLLFNNVTTGLFLVMALGELTRPATFAPLGKAAYPIALVVLLADLACLVFDLGSPTRFHHMLRVFKPTSPMSLGTWCLTAYSLPLTVLALVDLATAFHLLPVGLVPDPARKLCLVGGLGPALGSAVYKGVLFSTSSQPAWRDARWLGAYLVGSALMYGSAALLTIARAMGEAGAAGRLRAAFVALLAIHCVPLTLTVLGSSAGLARAYSRAGLIRTAAVAFGLGIAAPLGLALATSGAVGACLGLAALLAGGMAIRRTIVMIPHLTR